MTKVNETLAEIIGIILGDGYFYVKRKKNGSGIVIAQNSVEDLYYIEYLINLFNRFGIKPKVYGQKNKNVTYILLKSNSFIEKLILAGLKPGRKINPRIPNLIKKGTRKVKRAFLRGLSDTDFSISFRKGTSRKNYTYPQITTAFSNLEFVREIQSLIEEFGIKVNMYNIKTRLNGKIYQQYSLHIYGRKNLDIWMKHINFRNEKHLSKIKFYEKFGYCPPNTTVKYRTLILKNKIYK